MERAVIVDKHKNIPSIDYSWRMLESMNCCCSVMENTARCACEIKMQNCQAKQLLSTRIYLYKEIGLKFKREKNKISLHLSHSFVWC
jgi:hypothetical protein